MASPLYEAYINRHSKIGRKIAGTRFMLSLIHISIAYAEMVSWVWLLVMYLFRLAAKKDDAL